MCSSVSTLHRAGSGTGTALKHGSASCSHSALCLQKHFCQATHQELMGSPGWTLTCREVRSGTRAGQGMGSSSLRWWSCCPTEEMVLERAQNPRDCSASIPMLHPGSQVIFNTFLIATRQFCASGKGKQVPLDWVCQHWGRSLWARVSFALEPQARAVSLRSHGVSPVCPILLCLVGETNSGAQG